MSSFFKNLNNWDVNIPETRECDGVIWFVIRMRIGSIKWMLEHRYSEFLDLHKNLVANHSVSKDLLPPKLIFKKMSPEILENRRKGLEDYINSVLRYLSNTMPPSLVSFLDLDIYDMWFVFKKLASTIRTKNWIECPPDRLVISNLQANALSERLKLPCPPVGVIDSQVDFCTVLELFNLIKDLKIVGDFINKKYVGISNIYFKKMPFELSSFRALKSITFSKIYMKNFIKADDARSQVQSLKIHNCKLKNLADGLMCDNIHKNWKQVTPDQLWQALEVMDVSHNLISEIDTGLELMPQVTTFDISFNQIINLHNISKLQNLKILKMSHNHITSIDGSIMLPCLNYLDLSNNEINHIIGITQFPALETVNLSFNKLDNFDELDYISQLSNVLNVDLIGNPISQKTDYRVKALGKFGNRTPLMCLDNEQCTAHEVELIAVFQAIKFVQEGRSLSYNKNLSLNI